MLRVCAFNVCTEGSCICAVCLRPLQLQLSVHVFVWRLPEQSSAQGLKKSNHSLSDQQLLWSLSVHVITSRAWDLIAVSCELPSTATMLHCSVMLHHKLLTDSTRMEGMYVFIKIPPASILHITNTVFLSPLCVYSMYNIPVCMISMCICQPEINFLNRFQFCPPFFHTPYFLCTPLGPTHNQCISTFPLHFKSLISVRTKTVICLLNCHLL